MLYLCDELVCDSMWTVGCDRGAWRGVTDVEVRDALPGGGGYTLVTGVTHNNPTHPRPDKNIMY